MLIRSQFQELPSSETVETELRNALTKASKKLASLPWKDRPETYQKAIHTAVVNLKDEYNRS